MDPEQRETPKAKAVIPGFSRIRGVATWNLIQNRVALAGVVLVLLLVVFPPWDATAPNGITGSVGHYLVFSTAPAEEYKYPSVDFGRLFLEIFGVALVSAVTIFVTRGGKDAG